MTNKYEDKTNKSEYINRVSLINILMALAIALITWGIVAIGFDFFYDLNDDVLIKDILSGAYTGTPSGYNNQMMYPISVLIAGLYRLIPSVPWYGIILMGGLATCVSIIVYRLLCYTLNIWIKLAMSVFAIVFILGVYLDEITNMTYTVVSAMLATAACVWVLTDNNLRLRDNIVPIVLCIISFNIRSEMFLLMCPYMAAVTIIKFIFDLSKKSLRNLSIIATVILAGIVITFLIDTIAYSGSEWREYRRLFDARTEVYDFTGIPEYDTNEDFYESEGITREQWQLLVDYNYALDENITADTLEKIASYVRSGEAKDANGNPYTRANVGIKTAIGQYIRSIVDFTAEPMYMPLRLIVTLLFIALIILSVLSRRGDTLVGLAVVFLCRSVPWIYFYYSGRPVERLSHPMFFIEAAILLTMLCQTKIGRLDKGLVYLTLILILVLCVVNLKTEWSETDWQMREREEVNASYEKLCEHTTTTEGYYLIDVYSTVDYTEKVFAPQVDKSNQMLAGGWMAGSPLDAKKEKDYELAHPDAARVFVVYDRNRWNYSEIAR
ncbi:hypothetical protein [Lacrimispora saccharolytica]|uniref:hypothetical protein n=1 Tax=Lacrimispora saccharolytica TaxID=84030 RepID=UPI00265CDCD4|nr:hypothetical protein [Lacrimispora saccharolytica]MCF2657180.1 hypothetical protein [Lacrimispora saccharolytica]